MSVIGPDLGMAAGPNLDLGPADILTTAHPDDPGRHMIAVVGEVPVLPREEAVRLLEKHGYAGLLFPARRMRRAVTGLSGRRVNDLAEASRRTTGGTHASPPHS
ncbi:hypothetical protein OG800_50365 (plasmid) [Streptomyces sp. NBC_00445]|uniref:hypothetical protein n=1 Tax=Streptomyces sp. NBC_00445 TaxID=2975745 RepID=UPI002E1C2621